MRFHVRFSPTVGLALEFFKTEWHHLQHSCTLSNPSYKRDTPNSSDVLSEGPIKNAMMSLMQHDSICATRVLLPESTGGTTYRNEVDVTACSVTFETFGPREGVEKADSHLVVRPIGAEEGV